MQSQQVKGGNNKLQEPALLCTGTLIYRKNIFDILDIQICYRNHKCNKKQYNKILDD